MTRARDLASGSGIEAGEVLPHIIPDVLYPAVAGKGIDGSTTVTSFGTDFAISGYPTLKYYYTDIKGSKPIKDPRIGAHFGSQRYKFKSIQLLEQETATHGSNVYSVDGREWLKAVGSGITNDNNSSGQKIRFGTADEFVEIVGYFNDINIITYTESGRGLEYKLDGGTQTTSNFGTTTVATPLTSRFVDAGSLVNLGLSPTLGIHTIKLVIDDPVVLLYGIELIAQDTSSTANKSKIQIPAQNVVSYGKKFAIPATAQHYDPFDGMSGAKTLAQLADYIDTGTSLGMENWKAGTSNYYKPFNGGRVVKWVDSDGTIKTSVTMMSPNAQNIGTTASNAFSDGEVQAGTNDHTITFNTSAVDNSQAEVAKTFHWREFGNGSANGNSTYADASTLDGYDDIAYVMDDGLTSLCADDVNNSGGNGIHLQGDDDDLYITFIGTGIALKVNAGTHCNADNWKWHIDGVEVKAFTAGYTYSGGFLVAAQNLPYGTHIFHLKRVTANCFGHQIQEVTFYQPKMPPIPESACIVSDFMLMASFVGFPNGTAGDKAKISKGVRRISASRDVFYDSASALTFGIDMESAELPADGFRIYNNHASTVYQLPYFGTSPVFRSGVGSDRSADAQFKINGTLVTTSSSGTNHSGTQVLNSWATGSGSFQTDNDGSFTMNGSTAMGWASVSGITLGQNTVAVNNTTSTYLTFNGYDVASPIHTSSHYQPFETPFLNELVGGDRNMEQNNLVVTPDGKSWDEVTRDTSYIGNIVLETWVSSGDTTSSPTKYDEWRGQSVQGNNLFNKDFAIAYDRMICLKDGHYRIKFSHLLGLDDEQCDHHIDVNGATKYSVRVHTYNPGSGNPESIVGDTQCILKRGDYIQHRFNHQLYGGDYNWSNFTILRLN